MVVKLELGFSVDYNAPGEDGHDCLHGMSFNEMVQCAKDAEHGGYYAMIFIMCNDEVIDLHEILAREMIP